MNNTSPIVIQQDIQQQLWMGLLPIVLSFTSVLGTLVIAYLQKKLNINVKDTKQQIIGIHESHIQIRSQLASIQGSQQNEQSVNDIALDIDDRPVKKNIIK